MTDPATSPSEGLLDTCVIIDLMDGLAMAPLPATSLISAISLAELSYGVALAANPVETTRRSQMYARVKAWLDPLPFDGPAAEKYGELVALVRTAGRQPRPCRIDLMIAAVAAAHNLPLYTRDKDAFRDLELVVNVVNVTLVNSPLLLH